MSTYLEDLIRDAQQRQAGRAVPPERILAKLPVNQARVTRRRPRGALMVAAVCALVLVVAAVPVAIRLATPTPADGAAWSGTVPDFGDLPSPREVWPDAVHRIPDTLPGGAWYTVSAVLGGGRYLVRSDFLPTATTANDLSLWPVVFDTSAGTARSLNGPAVSRFGAELGDVFVSGGDVLWGLRRGSGPYEVWSAPVDGSSPARLLTAWRLGGQAYPIGADAGVLYWRYEVGSANGIYRMPLRTLVPEKVDGSEGFQDFGAFPWVSSRRPTDVDSGGLTGVLLNVVTGERRGWTAHEDTEAIDCNPAVCVGLDSEGWVTVQRLDGEGFQRIPYRQRAVPYERSTFAGRFGLGSFIDSGGQTWIWDRATGAAATMPRMYAPGGMRMPLAVVQWEDVDGAKYILDLAAIS